jgi:hypothetical protein
MMPLVRLSKSRASSSMAKMMPASGVLNAADSPAAGQQQPPLELRVAMGIEAPHLRHDRRTDVHRRPFAADGQASEQPDEGNDDLANYHANAEEASHQRVFSRGRRMERRNHLRDTAAFAAREPALGQKEREDGQRRRDDEREPNVTCNYAKESVGCVRAPVGVQHRDQPDQKRRAPGQSDLQE